MVGTPDRAKFVHIASVANVEYIFADLNLPKSSLSSPSERKACPELQRLLPRTSNEAICDVLFEPGHVDEGGWLFKSRRILVVSAALTCTGIDHILSPNLQILLGGLFGQNAPRGRSATNTLSRAYIWQLKTVTPPLIALAATVVGYFLFSNTSSSSHICRSLSTLPQGIPLLFRRAIGNIR